MGLSLVKRYEIRNGRAIRQSAETAPDEGGEAKPKTRRRTSRKKSDAAPADATPADAAPADAAPADATS